MANQIIYFGSGCAAPYHRLSNFHAVDIEYDNLVYVDFTQYLPLLRRLYSNQMAITRDRPDRAIAGLMYIDALEPLSDYCQFVLANVNRRLNDMQSLGAFDRAEPCPWLLGTTQLRTGPVRPTGTH